MENLVVLGLILLFHTAPTLGGREESFTTGEIIAKLVEVLGRPELTFVAEQATFARYGSG